MNIELDHIAKKFKSEWIFKDLSYTLSRGKSYAVIGYNGSGKSTFIQVLAGVIPPTKGKVSITSSSGEIVSDDDAYSFISMAAPYMELIEELTLKESIDFHEKFKPLVFTQKEFLSKCYLTEHQDKKIGEFSSGMKQRFKLGLAMFSANPCVVLDEPTSNLDAQGCQWYLENVQSIKNDKLLIISSNDESEYGFCDESLDITNFK